MKKTLFSILFSEPQKTMVQETNFLEHHKKYSHVMQELKQTVKQKEEFYKVVINKSFNGETVSSRDVINHVTLPTSGNLIRNGEVCTAFTESAQKVADDLIIRNYEHKKELFCSVMKAASVETFKQLADIKKAYVGIPISENPYFQEAVRVLSASMEKNTLPVLLTLIQYTEMCETLTYMSSSQKLSIVLGFKLYTKLYSSFTEPGSFTIYLDAVHTSLMSPEQSLVTRVDIIIRPVLPVLGTLLLSGLTGYLGYHLRGPSFQVVPQVSEMEKFIPSTSLRSMIESSHAFIRGYCFTVGRSIYVSNNAFLQGLFGPKLESLKVVAKQVLEENSKT